jgi:hypothetical protein
VQQDAPTQRSSRTHRHSGEAQHIVSAEQQDTPSQRCSKTHRRSGAAGHTFAAVQQDTSSATVASLKSAESRKKSNKIRDYFYVLKIIYYLCVLN